MARRLAFRSLLVVLLAVAVGAVVPAAGAAESYQRISGEGSSWAAGAIDAMRVNVKQFGITVDYNPSGSTAGRKNFLNGTVDFAASDIPFQLEPEDGSPPENPEPGSYAYIPVTAGGTAFMYNLKIGGKRVTNLRLSGENVAKIFTGAVKQWSDPAIAADNPGLDLPARNIVPVVRSDGSGSTAQFTKWLIARHGSLWNAYCKKSGRAPKCGFTSFYPTTQGMIAQSGDLGVAGYVAQGFAEGAIGYVNYSYALGAGFPVAKVLNTAGYYTEPTPENVAVSLLKAKINNNKSDLSVYLTQELDGVYTDSDPRNYQLSSYSYFVLPTKVRANFNEGKGRTLGAFTNYAMCQAQQQSASLGYSPMPINLVQASFEQIKLIPGAEPQNIDIKSCKNPTFSSDGSNTLAKNAPQPKECDKKGPNQCPDGTAGARNIPTAVKSGASGGSTSGGSTSGGATGGSSSGGSTAGGAGAAGSNTTTGGGTVVNGGSTTTGGSALGSTTTGSLDGVLVGTDSSGSACDAETGLCGGGSDELALGPINSSSGSSASPSASPTVLPAPKGWSGALTLTLVIILMTVALVLAPAYVWVRFGSKEQA